jgi:hypothetical protein
MRKEDKMTYEGTDLSFSFPYGNSGEEQFMTNSRKGRIRGWVSDMLTWGTLFLGCFVSVVDIACLPYDVVGEDGKCQFIIQPTGWDDGDVYPCGAVSTYGQGVPVWVVIDPN